ncbi:DgyrCDS5576 [Dimorphilus gyrociliatus]|uniref:DgyrCDS5576 n=1 Tax=Dimorphilus gyrociliatus TaxID=2664684 RepID=A0A7I8VKA7_9ANNE|nr:DgyrCDS5576 [Dimorphilus gyrociliatus]
MLSMEFSVFDAEARYGYEDFSSCAYDQRYQPPYVPQASNDLGGRNLWHDMDSVSIKMEMPETGPQYDYTAHNGHIMQLQNSNNYPMAPQQTMNIDTMMPDYSSSSPPANTSPTSTTTTSGSKKKTKEDKICGVCGDRALGYNFDAISCESCKAFFRRNAPKGLEYFKCPYDEKCKMDISNRRFCKRCRLKKCFDIGMRKEYILTEEEKAAKRRKIEENRMMRDIERQGMTRGQVPDFVYSGHSTPASHTSQVPTPPMSMTHSPNGPMIAPPPTQHQPQQIMGGMSSPMYNSTSPDSSAMSPTFRALSPEEHELIAELESAYNASVYVKRQEAEPSRESVQDMSDLVNIAEISIRRVIEMVKKIYAFKKLSQVDQIALLKGGCIELLILRGAQSFDADKQRFLEGQDSEEASAMNLDQLRRAEGSDLFNEHMMFVKDLSVDLKADRTTLSILLVINLFSPDRPGLKDKIEVSLQQERYSTLLRNYLTEHYGQANARFMFPKLLLKLTDIRNLNEEHSQILLRVKPDGIQPLMQEVLNLKSN